MTGYARTRRDSEAGAVVVSVRSVNHRGLDLHFHLPAALEQMEARMRQEAKRRFIRGHLDIRATIESNGSRPVVSVDEPLMDAYVALFKQRVKAYKLDCDPDMNQLLRFPGVIREKSEIGESAELQEAAMGAFGEAMAALDDARLREGAELREELLALTGRLERSIAGMESERDGITALLAARLRERVGELLQQALEPQRLAQEVAYLADRSDIAEELTRLRIHCRRLRELIDEGVETGKRLDFLMQEMNREATTVLSKTSALGAAGMNITQYGLRTKADIEKIREQSLNLE
jgi:uncharacterized protein (TIGR00255 family)